TGKIERWTFSEVGGLNTANFAEPQLIKWTTFDGKTISGFLYSPDPKKFPGKRPVIVNIHGGPEGQFRPGFQGRNNYFLNELGVAIVFPNVRGSSGYGKTFLKLDNGMNRDHTHKDIGALLDWIRQSPNLDSSKIMITGGSYGGYMTWAIAYEYNDKICCTLPIVGPSHLVTLLEHTESYRPDLPRGGKRAGGRSKNPGVARKDRAPQQLGEDPQAGLCGGRQERPARALDGVAADAGQAQEQRDFNLVPDGQ